MGLISKFVSRIFGKKSKKSKGQDPSIVNVSELKDSQEHAEAIPNQDAARNAPILFVEKDIKDSKQLLQPSKPEVDEDSVPQSDTEEALNSSEISQSSISSPTVTSKKPPMCPRKTKTPEKVPEGNSDRGGTPEAESNLDSNSLLDVPRTPRGGFLSGSMTPRGMSGLGGSLTPRGLGSALAGALTPRGGSGHSFQRLD